MLRIQITLFPTAAEFLVELTPRGIFSELLFDAVGAF